MPRRITSRITAGSIGLHNCDLSKYDIDSITDAVNILKRQGYSPREILSGNRFSVFDSCIRRMVELILQGKEEALNIASVNQLIENQSDSNSESDDEF